MHTENGGTASLAQANLVANEAVVGGASLVKENASTSVSILAVHRTGELGRQSHGGFLCLLEPHDVCFQSTLRAESRLA